VVLLHSPTSSLFPYTTLFRSVYNLFRSNTAVAFSGDYRWTPPGRMTPGEARLEACERQIRSRDARCLKAVADDLNRPPHALEYRSEEHTSELQSLRHLVCRLL